MAENFAVWLAGGGYVANRQQFLALAVGL